MKIRRRLTLSRRFWTWFLQKKRKGRNSSGDYCNDGIVTNGCFLEDLSGWTASQWEWQEPGRASPIHLTSNTLIQTIPMEIDQRVILQFTYSLESGATLYLKVGGAINDIVISGPATDTYIGVEVSAGDTLTFAISSAANPSNNWIDNVLVEAYVWRPDAFFFQDVVDVYPNTMITSEPVTIEGMLDSCPVSVTGGEYDINENNTWLTSDSTINAGDMIRVRRESGDEFSMVGVVFRAGATADTFNITAGEAPMVPLPEQCIGYYKGAVSDNGSTMLSAWPEDANHDVLQQVPTSVLGDGSGIGTIEGLLTSATFTVGEGSDEPTCTVAGQLDIADGDNVWDLKIYHDGVLFADLAMTSLATTEYSSTPGLPDCVWSGFNNMDPDAIYQEHYDGVMGSDRLNEDGFGIDGDGDIVPLSHATAVTNYPGPIAADWSTRRVALQGDGTLYVELAEAIETSLSFTLKFGVKTQGLAGGAVIGGDGGGLSYVRTQNDELRVRLGSDETMSFSGYIDTGVYADVVLVANGTEVTVTSSGGYEGTVAIPVSAPSTGAEMLNLLSYGTAATNDLIAYIEYYNASGTLVNHWHLEDGTPYETGVTKAEDIVGGNHGTVVNATDEASIWTYVDVGDDGNLRLQGYNIDVVGYPGYSLQDPNNLGYDIHGNALDYKQGQWQTDLQSELEFIPPLGKPSCYEFGQIPIRLDDQPALSISENVAIGDCGMVAYGNEQETGIIPPIIDEVNQLTCILGEELWDDDNTIGTAIDNGDGSYTVEGSDQYVEILAVLDANEEYFMTYEIDGYVSGNCGVSTLTTIDENRFPNADGPAILAFKADGTEPTNIRLIADVAGPTFSNISVKQITRETT